MNYCFFRGTGYNKDLYVFINNHWYAFDQHGVVQSNYSGANYFKNSPQNVLHYEKVATDEKEK